MNDDSTASLVQGRAAERPARTAQLIVLLGCDGVVVPSSRHQLDALNEVRVTRGDPDVSRNRRAGTLTLAFRDRTISRPHARLSKVRDHWVLEDSGAKNGVFVNGVALKRAVLLDGDVLQLGSVILMFRVARCAFPMFPDVIAPDLPMPLKGMPTFSAELADALDGVARVASTALPLVVVGATGTGKDVLARTIHAASGRRGAFVPVNCGALPAGLVESMLFGHRRGAFSGADRDQPGLVRSANEGTLFLDELGDLSPAAQVALLRVLENHEVVSIGEARPERVDVRVVAAVQRPLATLVEEGRLRADLAARIAGYEVRLPPIVERREDLGLLIGELLPGGARLAIGAVRDLLRYSWPLNVRELRKALAVAAVLAREGRVDSEHLPEAVRGGDDQDATHDRLRAEITELLRAYGGNLADVARVMGKARTQVQRWTKRLAVDPGAFR